MTKQEIEYELKLKTNECEMLNNTLMQLYNKNVSQMAIDSVQSEVMSKMAEISKLREDINNGNYDKEKVEYSFYDKIPKEYNSNKVEKCGFYDSITKNTSKDEKSYENKKLSYENIYNDKKCKKLDIRDIIDKISLEGNTISSNLFLVDLEELGIEKDKVKCVDFDSYGNKISITFYDHMVNTEEWGDGSKEKPLIALLTAVEKIESKFDFKILHVNVDGSPVYVEKYVDAKIDGIYRSSLSYSFDDFASITVNIKYNNVYYEATDKE